MVWPLRNVVRRIFESVRALGNRRPFAGSIKVESGPAVAEGHRIGKIIEELVKAGGFVPRKLPVRKGERVWCARWESSPVAISTAHYLVNVVVTHTIAEQAGGQPQVVVIVKQVGFIVYF